MSSHYFCSLNSYFYVLHGWTMTILSWVMKCLLNHGLQAWGYSLAGLLFRKQVRQQFTDSTALSSRRQCLKFYCDLTGAKIYSYLVFQHNQCTHVRGHFAPCCLTYTLQFKVWDTVNDILFTPVVGEVLKFSLFRSLIVLKKECHVSQSAPWFFWYDL